MRVSNKNARSFVQEKKPFKGNNLFAEYEGSKYIVYSYGYHWPLYIFNNGIWFENITSRSVSTSKHKSQTHPHTDTTKLDIDLMKSFVYR